MQRVVREQGKGDMKTFLKLPHPKLDTYPPVISRMNEVIASFHQEHATSLYGVKNFREENACQIYFSPCSIEGLSTLLPE